MVGPALRVVFDSTSSLITDSKCFNGESMTCFNESMRRMRSLRTGLGISPSVPAAWLGIALASTTAATWGCSFCRYWARLDSGTSDSLDQMDWSDRLRTSGLISEHFS